LMEEGMEDGMEDGIKAWTSAGNRRRQ